METSFNRVSGNGGSGAAPSPRQGSSIDSVISRIETVVAAISHMTEKVHDLANTTMGSVPSPPTTATKIDHPPCTLQEHMSYLEDKTTRLDQEIARFF